MSSLLVIVPDKLSDLVKKGEITDRYYNPGNFFNEVHILITNNDKVNLESMQKTVGNAGLHIHNLPTGYKLFLRSLGWRPWLLKHWAKPAIALARKIRPSLIRCYGNYLNAYVANRIKEVLGIPYIVSLHINPDEDMRKRAAGWKQCISAYAMETVEQIGLRRADIVLPAYKAIIPYIKRRGVTNFEVVYNVLNKDYLKRKGDYRLHTPVRILSVGRQIIEKNPENLIRAVKMLSGVHLSLIGNGTHRDYLRDVVRGCRIEDRVTFLQSVPNDKLCSQLADYDIFATHSQYWEIAKAVMEPLLTGLPVVINKRIGPAVPEFQGDFLLLVENTIDGYYQALKRLIENDSFREDLGCKAYAHSQEYWEPDKMEAKVVEIYKRVMIKMENRI